MNNTVSSSRNSSHHRPYVYIKLLFINIHIFILMQVQYVGVFTFFLLFFDRAATRTEFTLHVLCPFNIPLQVWLLVILRAWLQCFGLVSASVLCLSTWSYHLKLWTSCMLQVDGYMSVSSGTTKI